MLGFFLYFMIYSFIGWAIESLYVSAELGKFVNRGFLNGPYCPIYGFGALTVIALLTLFKDNIAVIFFVGMALTSLIEYIAGYLLEKIFKAKWWDYSTHKFNINGRVSLVNSFYWGVLSVLLLKYINPLVNSAVSLMPYNISIILAWILLALTAIDLAVTIPTIITLNIRLKRLHDLYEDIQEKLNIMPIIHEKIQELKEKYNEAVGKRNILHKRIIFAFPSLRSVKFDNALSQLKNKINAKGKYSTPCVML